MELLNANCAIALLMEHASFVKLRHDRKDLDRPLRVPIPDSGAATLSWHSTASICQQLDDLCMHNLRICIVLLYGFPSTHIQGKRLVSI